MSTTPQITAKNRKTKVPRLGQRIIAGLQEALDAVRSGEPLAKRFTVHTLCVPDDPNQYDAEAVRATRHRIGASQTVFARLVGVSTIQVQSWEQGVRKPSRLACRLL